MVSDKLYHSQEINLKFLQKAKDMFFDEGEEPIAFIDGHLEDRGWWRSHFLILTERRIIIWVRDSPFIKDNHEIIDYKHISTIRTTKKKGDIFIEFDDRGRFFSFLISKQDLSVIESLIHRKMNDAKSMKDQDSPRIKKLDIIIKRTEKIRTEELSELLDFSTTGSLLNWLYTLPEKYLFKVKGEVIVFTQQVEIYCIYCQHRLEEVEDGGPIVCMNCGQKTPICEICKNIIHAGEKIVQVSTCGHVFHKEHIVEWIKVRGKCPTCKEEINEDYLIVFAPNS